MAGFKEFSDSLVFLYNYLESVINPFLFLGIKVFFFALVISFVAWGIFKFYNTLSKINFISLNLSRYNWGEHHIIRKTIAVIFYIIEYILIMPILIAAWYFALASILLVLGNSDAWNILVLSGAIIMAVRILSYYNEEISKDVAKLFPFIALSFFLLTPNFFDIRKFLEKIGDIPLFFNDVIYVLIFISIVEIIMRVVYLMSELIEGHENVDA